ncbi:MAG: hypothetical protein PHP23_09285 [Desulfobacterales bacterium]|nr:hypothetical protein [Desulfobacterales bacterium]MDD4073016.1 hypothetical protein [Desulfobacterales bacterium]MDD4391498.1 hypothetical protein [Desulfobacterales bacterium]
MLNVILTEIAVLAIYMSLWFVFGAAEKRFDVADTGLGPRVCSVCGHRLVLYRPGFFGEACW